MALGRTHFRIEAVIGAGLIAAAFAPQTRHIIPRELSEPMVRAFLGGYLFALIWLSPDLDLPQCDARRRWGPLGFIWFLYPKLFSHRGASHSILFGTLTRLVYLAVVIGLPAAAGLWATGAEFHDPHVLYRSHVEPYRREIVACLAGVYLNDLIHIVVDMFTDEIPGTA